MSATKAESIILLVAFIWGGAFVAADFAVQSFSPFTVLALRFGIVALIMLFPAAKAIRRMNDARRRHNIAWGLVIASLLFSGIALQTVGLRTTTPGKQSFIMVSYTFVVPFIQWCFDKKRPEIKYFLCAPVIMAGVGIISLDDTFDIAVGDIYMMLYALIFAFQIFILSKLGQSVELIPFTFFQMLGACIMATSGAIAFEDFPALSDIRPESLAGLFYLTFFSTAIAFFLQNAAQRHAGANRAAVFMSVEALFGAVVAVALAGEEVTARLVMGGTLILAAVIFSKVDLRMRKSKNVIKA